MGTLLRVFLSLLLVYPLLAEARVPRPEGGANRLELQLEKGDRLRIKQQRARRGEAVTILASFDAPELSGSRVELLLRPINGEVLAGQDATLAMPGDSSILPGSRVITSFGRPAPGSRVELKIPFIPRGTQASQLQAELRVLGDEPAIGRSVLTLGADYDGRLVRKKAGLLRKEHRQRVQSEAKTRLRSSKVLPFDESKFENALKTPSPAAELPGGGGQ